MKNCLAYALSLTVLALLAACGGEEPKAQWTPPLPDDASTRPVLQWMPESAQLALAIPSLAMVESALPMIAQWAALAEHAPPDMKAVLAQTASAAEVEGAATWKELLAAIGVDPNKPVGLFARLDDGGVEYAGIVPIIDRALFDAKLPAIAGHQSDFPLFIIEEDAAYFGSTLEFRQDLLARRESPAEIAYGTGDFPGKGEDEVVLLTRLGSAGQLLGFMEDIDAAEVQPLLDHLAAQCDEAVLGLGLEGNDLVLRLALHEMERPLEGEAATAPQPKDEALAPLDLHRLLAREAIAAANLRLSPGVLGLAEPIAHGITGSAENGKKIGGMAKGLLGLVFGDEIAAALTGFEGARPSAVAYLELKNRDQLRALLTMGTVIKDPLYDYKEIPVYKAGKVVPFDLYLALAEKHLVLATDEKSIKKGIDALAQASAEPIIAQAALAHASHGFALVRGKNVASALAALELPFLPSNLGFAGNDLMLTLDRGEGWCQAALALSNIQDLGKAAEAPETPAETAPEAAAQATAEAPPEPDNPETGSQQQEQPATENPPQ